MLTDACGSAGFLIRIIVNIVKYIRFIIPIILIIFIIFDVVKVVVSSVDDKAKKDATSKAVKRLIYAIIVFLIPTIVTFIFNAFSDLIVQDNNNSATTTSWLNCWLSEFK